MTEQRSLPWFSIAFGILLIGGLIAAAIVLPKDEGISYQKPGTDAPTVPDPSPLPPAPAPTPSPETEGPEAEILSVSEPLGNGSVIEGRARGYWYFEASFPIELRDKDGRLLATAIAQATEDWMTTEFVPFRAPFYFTPPASAEGTLVLKKDNPSGLPEHDKSIERPVSILSAESGANDTPVYLGFISEKDAEERDCAVVVPAVRVLPKTAAPAKAALEELLKGPTIGEVGDGMLTIIPPGAKLNSVLIKNGVATADFSSALNPGGGSCAVSAIRAQIEATLKQFPSVRDVVISIDGKTEGVLEP